MSHLQALLCILASLGIFTGSSMAALPDESTYEYVTKKYKTLLETTRSGCSRYANTSNVTSVGPVRYLIVLQTRGDNLLSGTMCNGVFEFLSLRVDCQLDLVQFNPRHGSYSQHKEQEEARIDKNLSRTVCALEAIPYRP